MKKLNITKEQFNRSRYFKDKYGELEYVSESGRLFKTDKGKVLRFKESDDKNLSKLNSFQIKVNSIHDQLENLISKYGLEAENDPDMGTYIDLLEEAEQKILRVSADIYERVHMG